MKTSIGEAIRKMSSVPESLVPAFKEGWHYAANTGRMLVTTKPIACLQDKGPSIEFRETFGLYYRWCYGRGTGAFLCSMRDESAIDQTAWQFVDRLIALEIISRDIGGRAARTIFGRVLICEALNNGRRLDFGGLGRVDQFEVFPEAMNEER
jgi:hypothetical protein